MQYFHVVLHVPQIGSLAALPLYICIAGVDIEVEGNLNWTGYGLSSAKMVLADHATT